MKREDMNQIERIQFMERILDEATEAVKELQEALEKYIAVQKQIEELDAYYGGADWRNDFNDDAAGKLPRDLKRGVLSEDAVYNFLVDNRVLLEQMREVVSRKE